VTVIYRLGIDARPASPERAGQCEGQTQKVHMCQNMQTDRETIIQTHVHTADKVQLGDAYTDQKKNIYIYLVI